MHISLGMDADSGIRSLNQYEQYLVAGRKKCYYDWLKERFENVCEIPDSAKKVVIPQCIHTWIRSKKLKQPFMYLMSKTDPAYDVYKEELGECVRIAMAIDAQIEDAKTKARAEARYESQSQSQSQIQETVQDRDRDCDIAESSDGIGRAFHASAREPYRSYHRLPTHGELAHPESVGNLASIYGMATILAGGGVGWHPPSRDILQQDSSGEWRKAAAGQIAEFFPQYCERAASADPVAIAQNFVARASSSQRMALMRLADGRVLALAQSATESTHFSGARASESADSWNGADLRREYRLFRESIRIRKTPGLDSDTFVRFLLRIEEQFPEGGNPESGANPPLFRNTFNLMDLLLDDDDAEGDVITLGSVLMSMNTILLESERSGVIREIRTYRDSYKPSTHARVGGDTGLWKRFGLSYEDFMRKSKDYLLWKKWIDPDSDSGGDPFHIPESMDAANAFAVGMMMCILPSVMGSERKWHKPPIMEADRIVFLLAGILMKASRMSGSKTDTAVSVATLEDALRDEPDVIWVALRNFCIRECVSVSHLYKRMVLDRAGVRSFGEEELESNLRKLGIE